MLCQHGAVMLVEKTSVVLTKCCIKRDDMVSLARYTVFCFEELLEQAHHAHDKLFSSTVLLAAVTRQSCCLLLRSFSNFNIVVYGFIIEFLHD